MALVRVRKDGFEFNVGAAYAATKGLEVIDSPTHRGGRPRGATRLNDRPRKPRKSIDDLAAERAPKDSVATATEKAADQSATDTAPPSKEN